MRTTILALALAATTFSAFAQGRISIANDSLRLFEIGALPIPVDAIGPIANGPLASGYTIILALYAGTTSGSMTLQTSYGVTGANFLAPGRTATKPMTLTGVPGGVPQFFNLILTDNQAFLPNSINGALIPRNAIDVYNSAALAQIPGANYYGSSGLFQFTPSTSAIAAPAINGPGSTWATGSIYINGWVPEPSSVALFGLGAGLVMLFRSRRN